MSPETVMDRIRKLFRLARDKGASEAEAASALAMAQAMMLKYNIDHVDESAEAKSRVRVGPWMNAPYGEKWEITISQACAQLYSARSAQRPFGGKKQVQFIATPENIEACETTYLWVHEQVESLYTTALKLFHEQNRDRLDKHEYTRLRGEFKKTFKEACAMRIYKRAKEIMAISRNEIPESMALVVIDNALAEADELISGYKKGRSMSFRHGFGTGAGQSAGNQINLQRGMGGGNRRLT